jgi:V-type H+-transporting ATPase subunit G
LQEREKHFKDYEHQYLGTKDDIEQAIRKETEATLLQMQRNVGANKQQVIVRLLQLVCDIRPELHHNLLLQQKLNKK